MKEKETEVYRANKLSSKYVKKKYNHLIDPTPPHFYLYFILPLSK